MLKKLDSYEALSNKNLSQVAGGAKISIGLDGDLWTHARDWLWGFKNGLEGRSRHHRSWRDRD